MDLDVGALLFIEIFDIKDTDTNGYYQSRSSLLRDVENGRPPFRHVQASNITC